MRLIQMPNDPALYPEHAKEQRLMRGDLAVIDGFLEFARSQGIVLVDQDRLLGEYLTTIDYDAIAAEKAAFLATKKR